MSQSSRDESISAFQNDEDVKILIATYKTGGFGIDLSKANKCILVDLWWNEAVEYQASLYLLGVEVSNTPLHLSIPLTINQAYGRLLRLNQTREMECIKLLAKGSFDERMLDIQKRKTMNIERVISQKILEDRATIKELLGYFGDVKDVKGGGFEVDRHPRGPHDQTSNPTGQ